MLLWARLRGRWSGEAWLRQGGPGWGAARASSSSQLTLLCQESQGHGGQGRTVPKGCLETAGHSATSAPCCGQNPVWAGEMWGQREGELVRPHLFSLSVEWSAGVDFWAPSTPGFLIKMILVFVKSGAHSVSFL